MAAVLGGAVLLQTTTNDNSKQSEEALAVDRGADQTANRGGERSDAAVVPAQVPAEAEVTTTVAPPPTTPPPTTAAPVTAPPTTAPKPKAAAAPKPKAAPAPAPKPTAAPAVRRQAATPTPPAAGDDVWVRLAQCESGMRNDLGAPYYGYFQFSPTTWRSIGGTGLPSDHSYEVQLAMAKKLQARSGWGQWPVCGKRALAG